MVYLKFALCLGELQMVLHLYYILDGCAYVMDEVFLSKTLPGPLQDRKIKK